MYTELHARSAFSFLEGASIPEELAGACVEQGMGAMALLDRDGVYGAPRFHLAARKLSLQAHIGAEVTSSAGWRYPLLVESRAGYQNLCRLITQMKLQAKKGKGCVSVEDLAGRTAGLVVLTGGDEGPLAHALRQGGMEQATQCVRQLCDLFSRENVYIELQRHFCREEEARNQAALEIARKLSLPLLATNGVCHAFPGQREVLDVFTCIRHHRTLATAGRLLARNSERHLKSPAEMKLLFSDLPEAIANSQLLSSRLQFSLQDMGYQFPKYPVPDGRPQMQFLRDRACEGMIARYGSGDSASDARVRNQIERELDLIEKLELPGYFLIVWDIVRFCREHNILVQGRGSAANSAVCYALGITAVDPIGMDLLFERFLSEERGEWPDIDLDLPSGDQRERAIQYVYERYGKLGAAMTANVITYRGRSAAREIGKALSIEPETLNRLAGLVGAWEYKDANDTLARQFHDAGLDARHPLIRKFFELCIQVQDLPRHLGQHSGGMVVCQGQLDSIVPLEPATMPERVVVQWDKEDCTDMGIVKIDLLGLGMMSVLEDSLKIIQQDYAEEIDLGRLPANDPAVYDALQKADTVGMFQIESRAQNGLLAAPAAKMFLRHRGAGGHHPSRAHRGPHGASLFEAPPGTRAGHLSASFAGVGTRAHARCAALSRAIAAHGHDRRGIYRGRSGGVAPRLWIQTLRGAHERRGGKAAARHGAKSYRCGDAGKDRSIHCLLCAVWLPGIARGQLCPACLCQRLPEMPLSARLYCRAFEQSAHGFLSSRNHRQGRSATWPASKAHRRDSFRLGLQAGKKRRAFCASGGNALRQRTARRCCAGDGPPTRAAAISFYPRFETARSCLAEIRIDRARRNRSLEFYRIARMASAKAGLGDRGRSQFASAATPCGRWNARHAAQVRCSRVMNWSSIRKLHPMLNCLGQARLCYP